MPTQGAPHQARETLRAARAKVAGAYVAVAALMTAIVTWGQSLVPQIAVDNRSQIVTGDPPWIDAWVRWDSNWYGGIAENGYFYTPGQQSPIAFFPSYPMAVRGVTEVTGDYQVSGVLITLVCGLLSVLLFHNWVRQRVSGRAAGLALASLMAYPYAFFIYGAMYSDALFLLCVLAAFTCLEKRWFLLAGLIGAVATAGRPVGLALVAGLCVRTLEMLAQDRARAVEADGLTTDSMTPTEEPRTRPSFRDLVGSLRDLRFRHVTVLTAVLGLAGWCFYLWREFGNPLAFAAVQGSPGWDQGSGPRTWFKIGFGGQMLHGEWDIKAVLFAQAFVCLLAVLAIPQVFKRFGWGYATYVVVVLGIPLIGSKDFLGCGRYVMMAFPVFAVLGALLVAQPRRWVRIAVPVASAIGLVVATFFYGLGVLVS